VVNEETVISAETTLLSFVKPSAVKGVVEEITIRDRHVKMDGKKLGVDKFCGLVAKHTASGLHEQPIPDNVKWIVRAGVLETYIIELKPELRSVKWLADDSPAPYGSQAKYTQRKLATPYVVLKVTFVQGQLQHAVELFYRNLPLSKLDDELYHCNLYNVSINAHQCRAWFCTQHLNVTGLQGPPAILHEVVNHVWGGGFNQSSEYHEGVSGFALANGKTSRNDKQLKGPKLSPTVRDVNQWEEASEADPRFVLEVEWHPAGCTVRELIEGDLKRFSTPTAPDTSTALGNILLASRQLA
jgi:hypothetical protein